MKQHSKTTRTIVLILSLLALSALLLSACAPAAPAPQPAVDAEQPAETAALKLKVGASPVPHGDILKFVKDNLAAAAGLELEIVEFTDYVQPNLALADGQIDANYFQHVPYMDDFAKEHNLKLSAVTTIHIEPLGVYSKKIKSLDELPQKALVAIPNDATNAGRALNLLAAHGVITLKEGAGFSATVNDITENAKEIEIKELEAAQLVRALDDVSAAVINGNYAIEAGLKPAQESLALESGENNPYANILTVVSGHEKDEAIQKLAQLLNTPEVKKYIEEKYEGAVIPAFE